MKGRVWYAVTGRGNAKAYKTPYAAMMALDKAHAEGDLYTVDGTGPRVKIAHRSAEGQWSAS